MHNAKVHCSYVVGEGGDYFNHTVTDTYTYYIYVCYLYIRHLDTLDLCLFITEKYADTQSNNANNEHIHMLRLVVFVIDIEAL